MSNWTTDTAANRTKKSYFNGFIDMSGGELTVRHRGANFGGDVSFGSGVDISGDISTRGDVDISGTLTVTEDLSAHALVAAQQLTVAGDASFAGVNIVGNLNVNGSITSGGGTLTLEGVTLTGDLESDASISTVNLIVDNSATLNDVSINGDLVVGGSITSGGGTLTLDGLTLTGDLSAHTLISTVNLIVDNSATFNDVSINGDLVVGGSITSGGGTLTLQGLTLTGDLDSDASISTVNLNVVSDASFGNNVYIDGSLDVAGDVSAGAGAFTGDATAYRSITGVTGVYMGAFGNNAMMNIVSEGDGADIRFSSDAGGGTTGNIIYHNESETDSAKKSSFRITPHYANQSMGLQIQSLANLAAEVSIEEGMLTIKRGLESSIRNYESLWAIDGSNAYLGMNTYPYNPSRLTNAYFHIEGADGHDLLLTGHGYSTTGDSTRGFNLYSKQATYGQRTASHGSQGLCIQTSYYDGATTSFDFRLGIGDRPKAYQFLTTRDAKIGGKLDVDGSLNVTDDASFGGDLIVHGAGMFTGSTDIDTRTAPSGVYIGNKTDENNIQDSIIQMTSTRMYSVIDFTRNGATGFDGDFEGRIFFTNGKDTTNPYSLYLVPRYLGSYAGLRLDSISNNLIQARVDGDLRSTRNLDVSGAAVVDGNLTVGNTLTIDETGAGTTAGDSSGSILLKRSSKNGRSSIVFDSVNSGDDFAYIEFQDEGGSGNGSANGQLTIGVQNDTSDAAKERIRFDIAGAYAYLQVHDDGSGGNLGSIFSVDATSCKGIYPESYNLNTEWETTLDYYDTSGSETNRYTMYQYFKHTRDDVHDMALVGYNAGTGSGVNPDGNLSYGYMYRSRGAPNKFIAFQTSALQDNTNNIVDGMRLGVNAVPGYTYDFAVGGKSHFGNDVDISGDLTVSNGAGIFTGVSTNYNNTISPAGVYIGKFVNDTNDYANMQIVSNNTDKKSWIDFVNNGTSETDYEGRIAYYGAGGTTNDISKSFVIHPYGGNGGGLTLQSLGSSAAEAAVDGMLTLQGGVGSNIRDYESASYWNDSLNVGNDYRSDTTNASTANYLYVDNGFDGNADLLLTGHINSDKTKGYNLYSKGAVQAGATDQGLCIQTYYAFPNPTQCFRIGLGDRPGFHQFRTTGHVQVGGNLDVCGNLTVAGFVQYGTIETSTLTSTGNLTLQPTGKVHITRSLQVDGSINFNGDFIKADTLISITEPLDISNDDTGSAMIVRQYGSQPVAEFYDDNTLAMRIADDGIVTIPNNVYIDLSLNLGTNVKTVSSTGTLPNTFDGGIFNVISNDTPNDTAPFNINSTDYAQITLYVYVSADTDVKTPSLHLVKISQQDDDDAFNKPMFTEFWQSGANLKKAVCEFDVRSRLTNNTTDKTSGQASFYALLLNAQGGSNNETELAFTVKSERRTEGNNIRRLNWFGIKSEMLLNYDSSVSTKPVILSKSFNDNYNQLSDGLTGLFRVDSSYTPTAADPSFAYNAIPGDFSGGVYVGTHRYTENGNLVTSAEINMVSYTNFEYSGNYFTFWTPRAEHGQGRFAARFISGCNPNGNGDRWFTLQMTNKTGDVQYDTMVCDISGDDSNSKVTFDCNAYTTGSFLNSDLRLKTDIEPIESALDKVCRLRGVSYRLKENYDPESIKSLGMIAQELEQEFPELVSENRGYKNIYYYSFTAALLDSAKELKARNDALEAKHAAWEARIKVLEAELVSMDTALQALEVT